MQRNVGLLFRLFRVPNLLVVAITQYLVVYHILHPAFEAHGIVPSLYLSKFLEICAATMLITASGYVINDLQDEKIDEINRPGSNPVSELGRDYVLWLYGSILLIGFMVSYLLAFRLGERDFLWIYPISVGILAMYSFYLKRKPLAGNIVVAVYCAAVIALVVGAERVPLAELAAVAPRAAADALNICYLFMSIAILATLLRELVKDLEDVKGDTAGGRKTIPVLWGISTGQKIATFLSLVIIATLSAPIFNGWTLFLKPILLGWIALLIIVLIIIIWQVLRAKKPKDYRLISGELKLLLFGGLILLVLLKFN